MWMVKGNIKMNLQNRKRLTDLGNELTVAKEEGIVRELRTDVYTLLCSKWKTNRGLLYSTGNSTPCYVAAQRGVGLGENECVYMYG